MSLPETWLSVRLGEVCILNPRLPADDRPDGATEVTFVPMSAVDESSGTIREPEVRPYAEVAKGYTSFRERDVLFAKVTPCMENGKAAIATELTNGLGFGSTEFHVLRPSEVVLPEYLLQFVRQPLFRDRAASAFVGTGGLQRVPAEFLSRVRLPLPTLPEQQRIVDVLRQEAEVTRGRDRLTELLARTRRQLFVEMFGDPYPKHNSRWPVARLGSVAEVATGGTPPREQSDSYGGSIPWVKSTDLKDDVIAATEEHLSQLGIQRSNARVYPKDTILLAMYGQGQTRGRTGKLLMDAACNQACAALLPKADVLPNYLWAWLQLAYSYVRSLGRGGQQENLNLDIIRGIRLPKPPIALQQDFSRRYDQLLDLEREARTARARSDAMLDALRLEALTGGATSAWRENHAAEIVETSSVRDSLLRKHVASIVAPSSAALALEVLAPVVTVQRVSRQWLVSELSEFQRQLLHAFCEYTQQPLLAEDADVFGRFCDDTAVVDRLQAFGPTINNRIRRTLSQLSAVGLIAKITLPRQNPLTGELEYVKAFRPLREDEYTRPGDVEALRRALEA